jgi:two-component system, NtrC family, sensor kinase
MVEVRESRSQLAGTLLLILAVAAVIAGVLSFQHLRAYALADDGVTWVDRAGPNGKMSVVAAHIRPGGSGEKAGIHPGDLIVQAGTTPIHQALDVARAISAVPVLSQMRYTLQRNGIEFQKDNIFIEAAPRDYAVYYQYAVGFAYIAIGLFVYYRRTSATKSLHFFILCLASFIASTFHYSGKLNTFDEVIYWGNVVAGLLAPAIFLHFCLTFHATPDWLRKRGSSVVLYLPSALLILVIAAAAEGILKSSASLLEMRWLLDRVSLGFELFLYFCGAAALTWDHAHSQDPITRRQLKFLRNGALVGLAPFTLFYAIPYIFGSIPHHVMSLSVLSMALIPLTWAYAVTRYRLMDVDIIFQQGYVYTLATLAVIGLFYGLIFFIFNTSTITPPAFVVLISIATFVFQPIRRSIQEQLDRWVFYRDRYDARLTLIEFARELSSETDQNAMLAKVGDRLLRTLSLQHIGVFLAEEEASTYALHSKLYKADRAAKPSESANLDLSFLSDVVDDDYLFFERTRHFRDIVSRQMPQSVRDSISELDFTYYVPCRSRGKIIAFLGLSRTTEGEFLSQDDIQLVSTLSDYVAIAIENSRLYSSLQRKANEYERLKEFSENIVESINVGVLAAGLDDRVESWNPQIERLTGIQRDEAIGMKLSDLFSPELVQKFDETNDGEAIHNFYKLPLGRRLPANDSAEKQLNGRDTASIHALDLGKPPISPSPESLVNIAIAPLVSKDMTRIGRLIIFDDVTDRDELERRLVQADKLSSIGLLAAGVAHEVNTPLAVISTYAQMLTKQVADDEHKSKLLEKIAKQTFRASEIVNSLLNFSRTSPTEFIELDLNRVLRETCNLVEHQFEKAGVKIELALSETLPLVRGNSGKLQQVFLNLFINARDAMVGGGTLSVRSHGDASFVHVEVIDSGQGISPEHLARIYDPFFTTKGAKKGTGLGLSITYGIVQEHKGTIEVESSPGHGTCFRLDFPAGSSHHRLKTDRREALPA